MTASCLPIIRSILGSAFLEEDWQPLLIEATDFNKPLEELHERAVEVGVTIYRRLCTTVSRLAVRNSLQCPY